MSVTGLLKPTAHEYRSFCCRLRNWDGVAESCGHLEHIAVTGIRAVELLLQQGVNWGAGRELTVSASSWKDSPATPLRAAMRGVHSRVEPMNAALIPWKPRTAQAGNSVLPVLPSMTLAR